MIPFNLRYCIQKNNTYNKKILLIITRDTFISLEGLFFHVHDDIKYLWILFLLSKIGSNENENPIFHFYFWKNISVTNKDKIMKMSEIDLHIYSEGNLSEILYIGHSF